MMQNGHHIISETVVSAVSEFKPDATCAMAVGGNLIYIPQCIFGLINLPISGICGAKFDHAPMADLDGSPGGSSDLRNITVIVACLAMLIGMPPSSARAADGEPKAEQSFTPKRAKAADTRKTQRPFRDCPDCPEMVVIPDGGFTMGAVDSEDGRDGTEGPRHQVSVPSFGLGKYPVTFDQWDACVADGGCSHYRPDDRGWGRGDRPVINVNWDNMQSYVGWLNRKVARLHEDAARGEGGPYRLPSEAEWEYAARAGTQTARPWGQEIGNRQATCNGCGSQWDNARTAPVGSFPPNGWGLFDMLGNVWQWTADCWNDGYSGAPANGSAWTAGDCRARVVRGGSWNSNTGYIRSARRDRDETRDRDDASGFRVARSFP